MIQDLKNDFKNDLCDTNILIIIIILIKQELSHDSIARLNCALPITKTIQVTLLHSLYLYLRLSEKQEFIKSHKRAIRQ